MSDSRSSSGSTEEEVDSIWQAIEPSSSGLPDSDPAGRCGHVAVSSRDGQSLVVIGGYNEQGILSDVWEFRLETREWDRINVGPGPAPPERAYFRGCAGPAPGVSESPEGEAFAYLFGGTDAEGNASNDVWCLDVENRTWHEVHRGGESIGQGGPIPPARSNHAMCNMGGVLAVHSGESASNALLDDLWIFNPARAEWSDNHISPTGPRPCARSSHCLAYAERSADRSGVTAAVGSLVLFGGLGHDEDEDGDVEETMPLNDLWVLSPVSALGVGAGATELGGVARASTNESSCSRVWSLVVLDGVGPSPRSLSALSPRPCCGDLFLFGGYGLVELPAPSGGSSSSLGMVADGDEEEEGGDIIMAYIDDLWRLDLADGGDCGVNRSGNDGVSASSTGWVDEEGMGFEGASIVEGRNGHTLTWCGENLVLFGGFVGDGFDASVHVAEAPPSALAGLL